ncbi:DUF2336 domain-containing protein [Sphingomonas hylomeconis]|uniref:DUF2336 domain-containing protein n=1 Tax=Sphingomonas hylomeconis TaxID=1395958 RepID=A0ABV7SYN7_9SPHN|nr:DUF2336 domain-containing protein [Sphingomonas hylomeconis]
MASNLRDMDDGIHRDPGLLIARAAAADLRGRARLATAIDDFFLASDGRLDDRIRASIQQTLAALVATIEAGIATHAARLLLARDAVPLATALQQPAPSVLDRLSDAGLLRDSDLMAELIARARHDLTAAALPAEAPSQADAPSLLARLASHSDGVVASAANALFAAEGRRHGLLDGVAQSDLPAELHHRLVWWVAAALRERIPVRDDLAALDRALAEAAVRSLTAHDEGERLEAAAMRLAAAYDAGAGELPDLLLEALGDRRLALFTALLAQATGLGYEQVRALTTDPDGALLWLMLRALELDRTAIARIGLALCEADPRRDLEAFAASLDSIMAVPIDDAWAALAPLKLHPDYRAALAALAGART